MDRVEVVFYTDPLCCWSWGMEPQWRKLQYEYRQNLHVTYKMIGLLPAWGFFHDSLHSIRKPIQMGPEWVHAREVSGMPIADRIWFTNPPASSFPACIAVKCAQSQSAALGSRYLRILREAVMIHNRNIADTTVLIDLADRLARKDRHFDLFDFRDALLGSRGTEFFRKDYQQARYLGLRRTPTLLFEYAGRNSTMIQGYTGYAGLRAALMEVCPDISAAGAEDGEAAYKAFWHEDLTAKELSEFNNR